MSPCTRSGLPAAVHVWFATLPPGMVEDAVASSGLTMSSTRTSTGRPTRGDGTTPGFFTGGPSFGKQEGDYAPKVPKEAIRMLKSLDPSFGTAGPGRLPGTASFRAAARARA